MERTASHCVSVAVCDMTRSTTLFRKPDAMDATPPDSSSTAAHATPAEEAPDNASDSHWLAGLRIVSLCTLLSRILGMVRDMGMAAVFGNGPVMDAFTVAFRFPNLARRLFGEGALTTAFLPEYVRTEREDGSDSAQQLANCLLVVLSGVLAAGVLLVELILGALWLWSAFSAETALLMQLTAILFPYLWLICLTAQLCAILHAHNRFLWPALIPVALNIVWIAALAILSQTAWSPPAKAAGIATALVLAGGWQLGIALWAVKKLGFRWHPAWRAAWPRVRRLSATMVPVMLGLSITQINSILDGVIAWSLAVPSDVTSTPPAAFQLENGTASALYLGQRLYQFPLGIFGVALGTVLFPLFARAAADGDPTRLQQPLLRGLRLTIAVTVPASIGLYWLAMPITQLLFRHGNFDSRDAIQTATMIAAYAAGVWAYCGTLVLQRAFYAMNDRMTPLKIGLGVVALNVLLSFSLIAVLGGAGLAWATAISGAVQCLLTLRLLHHRIGGLLSKQLLSTLTRTLVASAAMAIALYFVSNWCPDGLGLRSRLLAVALPIAAGIAVFLLAAWCLRLQELAWLWQRETNSPENP